MSISNTIESYLEAADTGTANTRRTYRTAMNLFQKYLVEKEIPPDVSELEDLDVDRLLAFSTWLLEEAAIGQRTLYTYLAAVVGWVNLLASAGLAAIQRPGTGSPAGRVQEPSQESASSGAAYLILPARRRWSCWSLPHVRPVLRRPGDLREQLAKLRDIAIVEALRCSGLRVGELVSITRKQLEDEDRGVWVVGKGNKVRRVYFDERAWEAIHRYLQARQPVDGATGNPLSELPVFARHDRRAGSKVLPLTTQTVQNTIRRLAERCRAGRKGHHPPRLTTLLRHSHLPDHPRSGRHPDGVGTRKSQHDPHLRQAGRQRGAGRASGRFRVEVSMGTRLAASGQ